MRNESNVKGIAFMEALLMPIPSLDDFPPEMKQIFEGFRTPEVGWNMIGEPEYVHRAARSGDGRSQAY